MLCKVSSGRKADEWGCRATAASLAAAEALRRLLAGLAVVNAAGHLTAHLVRGVTCALYLPSQWAPELPAFLRDLDLDYQRYLTIMAALDVRPAAAMYVLL